MQRVIFFTAGSNVTSGEMDAITKLNDAAQAYSITVMNSKQSPDYGAGQAACDFVAGTIPASYSEVPTIDPDNMPGGAGIGVGGVVTVTSILEGSGDATVTAVTDGNGAATLPNDRAIIADGGFIGISNSTGSKSGVGTVDLVDPDNTVKLNSSDAIVSNGQASQIAVTGVYIDTVTFNVVNGEITGIVVS